MAGATAPSSTAPSSTAPSSTAEVRARLAAALAARSEHTVTRAEQVLSVHPALEGVAPRGLVRGVGLACIGPAAASVAALAVAGPTSAGSWACVVGYPELGVAAWHEAGVAFERVVLVHGPTSSGDRRDSDRDDDDALWGKAVAAAIDGFDLVVIGPQAVPRIRPSMARRLQARAQARGVVLVTVGDPGAFATDLRLHATAQWHGLGSGHGHLRAREVRLALGGRRMPRGRRDTIWFPGPSGRVERFGAGSAVPALRRTG